MTGLRWESCNSNVCMKLSFEGRQMSMLLRTPRRFCDLPGAGGRGTVRPLISRSKKRGASDGFHVVQQAEGMARSGSVLHEQARSPGRADLQEAGRGGRALEGDPHSRGAEGQGQG